MAIVCSHCGHQFPGDAAKSGQLVVCPNCNQFASLSAPSRSASGGASARSAPPPEAKKDRVPPKSKANVRGERSRAKSEATAQLTFDCPKCNQRLTVRPAAAGLLVHCPSCNTRIRAPEFRKTERLAWKERDPSNPPFLKSLGLGLAAAGLWYVLLLPFIAPAGTPIADYNVMQFLASLFYKHFVVSLLNTLFFTWAMAIIYLKLGIIRHQKAALLLDVLPAKLGKKIHAGNVEAFIDHVYSLPVKLRDSLMVNRIRKALELFEFRQNVSDVREMMVSQSEIDSARISGSYTLVRAFLWGIPLLGFIGTVVGLSHAIGGMNFSNVEDVGAIVGAINNVTSGLGTAFDATLLGLVLALTLNFPLNALAKQEDDNLQTIDAFCNEVLLPRLKDSRAGETTDVAVIAQSVATALAAKQDQFLGDLSRLSQHINEYADNLDRRLEEFQRVVTQEFVHKTEDLRGKHDAAIEEGVQRIVKLQERLADAATRQSEHLQAATNEAVRQSLAQLAKYLCGLEAGIASLNRVLADLGEKQVVITAPKKRRWFGRG